MLRMVLKEIYSYYNEINQPYLSLLYTTIISTMYHGLLRISETAGSGTHRILARDVLIGENKRKFLLVLRTSKTHAKDKKPQLIKIAASSRNNSSNKKKYLRKLPCPYQLLKLYSKVRGDFAKDTDPFFVHSDHSPVTPLQISRCLQKAVKKAGFNKKLYLSHSLRIGRTCDLYRLGLTVETIKKLGRWRSNTVFRYLRQ